jgi:hypothetical protein
MDLVVYKQRAYANDEMISIIWCGDGRARGVLGNESFVVVS